MGLFTRMVATRAPASVVLIRFLVGLVFISEGIQKFLFSESVGAGRFAKIGLPQAELLATVVGSFEIVCGLFICLGLLTRLAVIPTIAIMLMAIAMTKIPILLESGFWKMAHESRTDWSMLLGSLFLLLVGAGPWSLDAVWMRAKSKS